MTLPADASSEAKDTSLFVRRAIEASIRIGMLLLVIIWCIQIVGPFFIPVAWGIIIAVASYPFYLSLRRVVGDRRRLAAVLVSFLLLGALILPAVLLGNTLFEGVESLAGQLSSGRLVVPHPPESVRGWPLVGSRLAALWSLAASNLAEAVAQVAPHLKPIAGWLVGSIARAGFVFIQFLIAILIAGVLLAQADAGERVVRALAVRLAGDQGTDYITVAGSIVRSVTRGILGVAFIQATLVGLGLLVAGVPGAGLWALLCLIIAIVQIPIAVIQIPAIIYVFMTASTVPAVLFLIWNVLIMPLDNILKPILLGRGVAVPMAVIFIGAIGGAIAYGIIGLFVGAVVLVVAYKLFLTWLESTPQEGITSDPLNSDRAVPT